jgi:hypothetical protein
VSYFFARAWLGPTAERLRRDTKKYFLLFTTRLTATEFRVIPDSFFQSSDGAIDRQRLLLVRQLFEGFGSTLMRSLLEVLEGVE